MGANQSSLTSLIDPMLPDEFFSTYWEKQPLHIQRANRQFYDDIITLDNVQTAIAYGGLRYPAIQLSKSGAFLHPEVFCADVHSGDIVFTGVPDIDKIQSEYKSGATISLPGFHRAWQPLRELVAAAETYLNHAVHTNLYITPGNAAGFSPHYDTHDVLILQISGSKHWKIYVPPLALPHRSQPFNPQMFAPSAPLMTLDLQPGDLLYLPRGYIHTTNTSDSASMHVTLGVNVYTYVDLVTLWLQDSILEASMRRALPPGFASLAALKPSIEHEFSELIESFKLKLDPGQLLESLLKRVKTGYPGQCADAPAFSLDAVVINPHTKLKALAAGEYAILEEGDNIVLKFCGKTLVMSRRARATLDEICRRPEFQVADLPIDLQADTQLKLVSHLYQQGFLMLSKS